MIKVLFLILACFCYEVSEGALAKAAQDGLQDFRAQVGADPDLGAFEAAPSARGILSLRDLKRETYKERLYSAFLAYKTHTALTAAGHAPVDHSPAAIKAATEALTLDRDTHEANYNDVVSRIRVHGAGGEDVAGALAGGGNFHSDAKHTADVAAARAAGRAAKLVQVNGQLTLLEAFVRQQEVDGHIGVDPRDAILGEIARVRAAIA